MARKTKKKVEEIEVFEEKIIEEDIAEIMQTSYINYAMNVIVARALPDVRDGLKPVHRRVLYTMEQLDLKSKGGTKKSARIVGDAMGKYHPHGDSSVYDAMVRLEQDFLMRYPLVIGQGNFGSIDGDGAAAMRYTEAKLSPLGEEMLRDLDKNTVDFMPNFDATLKEPVLLPSRFPNLLVNGASGIAVGMATNMAPHNLREIVDAIVTIIDNPKLNDNDLLKIVKGPDFPTGGIIAGTDGIREAYLKGKGKLILRSHMSYESVAGGKFELIIHDIPYSANKPNLLEKIAELIRDGRLEGIVDIRDESDKNGIRIAVELKRGVDPEIIKAELYKNTELQTTFSIINIAIVDGEPKTLTLRELIEHYISFQREVVFRRTTFDLQKAEHRKEVLDALIIVANNLDEVIAIIKSSRKVDTAKKKLIDKFKLSEVQAQAILDLRLQRLINSEINLLKQQLKDVTNEVKRLKEIVGNKKKLDEIIKNELIEIRDKYSDKRKTEIVSKYKEIEIPEIVEESQDISVIITKKGLIGYIQREDYLNGKLPVFADDIIVRIFNCKTDDTIGVFTQNGNAYKIEASHLLEITKAKKPLYNVLTAFNLLDTEIVDYTVYNEERQELPLTFITNNGLIKRTLIKEFSASKQGISIINLKNDAKLIGVSETNEEIILVTKLGQSIRFSVENIRPIGRVAAGVIAMKLAKEDEIVSFDEINNGTHLVTITNGGYLKKTSLNEYNVQNRGGKGVIVADIKKDRGNINNAFVVSDKDKLLITLNTGKSIEISAKDVKEDNRAGRGEKIDSLSNDENILISLLIKDWVIK